MDQGNGMQRPSVLGSFQLIESFLVEQARRDVEDAPETVRLLRGLMELFEPIRMEDEFRPDSAGWSPQAMLDVALARAAHKSVEHLRCTIDTLAGASSHSVQVGMDLVDAAKRHRGGSLLPVDSSTCVWALQMLDIAYMHLMAQHHKTCATAMYTY